MPRESCRIRWFCSCCNYGPCSFYVDTHCPNCYSRRDDYAKLEAFKDPDFVSTAVENQENQKNVDKALLVDAYLFNGDTPWSAPDLVAYPVRRPLDGELPPRRQETMELATKLQKQPVSAQQQVETNKIRKLGACEKCKQKKQRCSMQHLEVNAEQSSKIEPSEIPRRITTGEDGQARPISPAQLNLHNKPKLRKKSAQENGDVYNELGQRASRPDKRVRQLPLPQVVNEIDVPYADDTIKLPQSQRGTITHIGNTSPLLADLYNQQFGTVDSIKEPKPNSPAQVNFQADDDVFGPLFKISQETFALFDGSLDHQDGESFTTFSPELPIEANQGTPGHSFSSRPTLASNVQSEHRLYELPGGLLEYAVQSEAENYPLPQDILSDLKSTQSKEYCFLFGDAENPPPSMPAFNNEAGPISGCQFAGLELLGSSSYSVVNAQFNPLGFNPDGTIDTAFWDSEFDKISR